MIDPITAEDAEKLQGEVMPVVSLSGGKDSTALCLWLREQGIEHQRVFADTGWEHSAVYEQIDYLEKRLGPIARVGYPGGMEALVKKKGMFPSRLGRFCTQHLKVIPIAQYLQSLESDVINVVGIRAAESKARSAMPRWEWQAAPFDCWVWRPLIAATEDDVIALHQRHAVKPCRLYLEHNVSRVGCWPCIFARKSEIRTIADIDPSAIDRLEVLEADVQEQARQRYAAKGETFESLGYQPPTFFHLHDRDKRKKRCVPIREVVEWSRTSHGGQQMLLEIPLAESDAGCMRWGMCEHSDVTAASASADDET